MNRLRLFFALWPDAEEALATQAAAAALMGSTRHRLVPAERLHMTLQFIGSVDEDARPGIEAAAKAVAGEGFDLVLERAGYWRRAGVAWLAPCEMPNALSLLVSGLRAQLASAGVALEQRPFRPHVTIARKAAKAPAAHEIAPLRWRVEEFCLVKSVTHSAGPEYTRLCDFQLA